MANYRNYSKKTGMKKSKDKRSKAFTKEVRKEIKSISYKTQETKQNNVPDANTPTTNTVGLIYPSASGLQYLFVDAFKVARGTDDGSQVGAANRIGNSIYALGMKLNYTFQAFTVIASPITQIVPFIRLRIIVFQASSSVAPPPSALTLLDTNFVGTGAFNTSTLQPIRYNGGFVKRVLYDKVKILKNQMTFPSSTPLLVYPQSTVYNFTKYIKLKEKMKYTTLTGEPTEEPIHCCIIAEVDNTNAYVASGQRLVMTSVYS